MIILIVNLILAISVVVISAAAFFFYWSKTTFRHAIWGILAAVGAVNTLTQTLVLCGVATEWYFQYERMVGYILLVLAIVCLLVDYRLGKPKSYKEKPSDTKPA